jgi:hypothetical protein
MDRSDSICRQQLCSSCSTRVVGTRIMGVLGIQQVACPGRLLGPAMPFLRDEHVFFLMLTCTVLRAGIYLSIENLLPVKNRATAWFLHWNWLFDLVVERSFVLHLKSRIRNLESFCLSPVAHAKFEAHQCTTPESRMNVLHLTPYTRRLVTFAPEWHVAGAEGLSFVAVWLRLSTQKQLDWSRNSNYQSKDIAHVQKAIAQCLADKVGAGRARKRAGQTRCRSGSGQQCPDSLCCSSAEPGRILGRLWGTWSASLAGYK